ncbi:hypothetical protein K435DRAFT_456867 [Dendrothele bispora CBS 962.96]|uniref:Uncharacterized protein n=1 Tax=Dendrothele bispora (strain CBS 962.96) TaxID=1314807 RepID=A0A4S8L1R3_DENBC|nr:hypothetical protein K435DRAFT_456867 [Dendrothele bispora CBS 962.96]
MRPTTTTTTATGTNRCTRPRTRRARYTLLIITISQLPWAFPHPTPTSSSTNTITKPLSKTYQPVVLAPQTTNHSPSYQTYLPDSTHEVGNGLLGPTTSLGFS